MSAHSLQRLLEGVRSDLADQLIRHAMAFSGTVHAAFNVLFAAIPQLPQSLLAITAVRQRDAGRSLCRRAGEATGGWRLRVNTDAPTYGHDFGAVPAGDVDATAGWCDGYPAVAHTAIGPYAALVFSQDPA